MGNHVNGLGSCLVSVFSIMFRFRVCVQVQIQFHVQGNRSLSVSGLVFRIWVSVQVQGESSGSG